MYILSISKTQYRPCCPHDSKYHRQNPKHTREIISNISSILSLAIQISGILHTGIANGRYNSVEHQRTHAETSQNDAVDPAFLLRHQLVAALQRHHVAKGTGDADRHADAEDDRVHVRQLGRREEAEGDRGHADGQQDAVVDLPEQEGCYEFEVARDGQEWRAVECVVQRDCWVEFTGLGVQEDFHDSPDVG